MMRTILLVAAAASTAALAATPHARHHATPRARRAASARCQAEEFDYLVLGGGSGGIASARRAAANGAKACVIERARLGGTCVNVGCVPKKVMFNAAFIKEMLHQADGYGYTVDGFSFSLPELKKRRDAYVERLNGIYKNNLKNSDVEFVEGDAKFVGPKTVAVGDKTYTAKHILVAVGGTPTRPDIPGIEHGITSDEFFDLEELPKKVAVVGSGYIAVELAGILSVLGSEVELFVRGSTPLRNLEPAITDVLVNEMGAAGIKLVTETELNGVKLAADGTKSISTKAGDELHGYDCVLFAIGRNPVTDTLDLPSAGIETTASGHIAVNSASLTSASDVYAIGDVIGKIDLTPVAIAAGRLLSDRLFAGASVESTTMDYDMVPTAIFSHPPIATQGLTEAEAVAKYGEENVECYTTTFVNMMYSREFLFDEQQQPKTRAKLVCVGPEQRVIGVHMIGLAVDEIMQGFSVALKMGATKADFDSAVAIHPTSSEELVTIPPWQAKYTAQPPLPENAAELAAAA